MKYSAYTHPCFSLQNRLLRCAWNVTYMLLFRPSPVVLHAWRAWLLRLFGAHIGRGCHIYPGVQIWAPWNLVCEDEVGVASGVILYNQAPIYLGYRVVLSQGAHLCTGTHDYTTDSFDLLTRPIKVQSHVWIAAEAFVHPGVTIAEGAVIGARSVVIEDMPAWHVCAGHPCKPRKPRVYR